MKKTASKNVIIDASRIITEALVQSGADVFIGYPITPSNLFYKYAKERFAEFLAGPDEISVIQWMSGYAAAGKIPVTATAFPGLALMAESINMAYMMELPMVIVVTQRLGPSTGSATAGAQGDLKFIDGIISGGFPLPVFSPSSFCDAWKLANQAVKTAVQLRTPVILLTSKEMVMTQKSFDLNNLETITKVNFEKPKDVEEYLPYKQTISKVPPFFPLGNDKVQTRFNSSTHSEDGLIEKGTANSLANTQRLKEKFETRIVEYTHYELEEEPNAEALVVTWGISAEATRDVVNNLRINNKKISLLVVKTLIPIPKIIYQIIEKYNKVFFVEENLSGMYKELLFGKFTSEKIRVISSFGTNLSPAEIEKQLKN